VIAVIEADGKNARRIGEGSVKPDLAEWIAAIQAAEIGRGDPGRDDREGVGISGWGEIRNVVAIFEQDSGADNAIRKRKRNKFHEVLRHKMNLLKTETDYIAIQNRRILES
jgi:hypothetical protein